MTLRYNPKTMRWEGETGGIDIIAHDKKSKLVNRKSKKSKTSDEVRAQNMQHKNYGYAYRLFDYVKQQMELADLKPLVFRNMKVCDHNWETKQIRFGYECIDYFIEKGYIEYKTMRYIWARNGYNAYKSMKDNQAVWATVLHEIAHHMQCERNGRYYGSAHNQCFAECLNELIILFPYNEVESI